MLAEGDLHRLHLVGVDLSNADLKQADLSEADLAKADLSGSDLTDADLYSVLLTSANLSGAKLLGALIADADLAQADLYGADLSGADLTGAILYGTNLYETDVSEAKFNGARAGGTIFGNVDLSQVHGLASVEHDASSTLGVDTIFRSGVRIPEEFLRGCGVPDEFLHFLRGIGASALELYSCFISYSHKDEAFAKCLHSDLQASGVRCWFAPHDIQGGRKIHEQIDDAIRLHDKLLLILSANSMASEWVMTEIAKARRREVEETKHAAAEAEAKSPGTSRTLKPKRVLFPVALVPFDPDIRSWECFDADTGKDSAREIREYFLPDFSNWKDHDSYQKAFPLHPAGARNARQTSAR